MPDDTGESKTSKIIQLHPGYNADHTPKTTIITSRRYSQNACQHKGPYYADEELAAVECGDCGAYLNPMFVLMKLAKDEGYWNRRLEDLQKYVGDISKELEERTRTKCVHCGNMTPIKFKNEMPHTW